MDVPALLSELDDHGFARYTPARKLAFLNEIYSDVCARAEWPFIQKTATVSVPTTGIVSGIADLLRVYSVANAAAGDSLDQVTAKEAETTFLAKSPSTTGNPIYFWQEAFTLFVWPKPTGTISAQVHYLSRANTLLSTDFESAILIPNTYHRVLIEGTLSHLNVLANNEQLAETHRVRFEDWIARMGNQLLFKPHPVPMEQGDTATQKGK